MAPVVRAKSQAPSRLTHRRAWAVAAVAAAVVSAPGCGLPFMGVRWRQRPPTGTTDPPCARGRASAGSPPHQMRARGGQRGFSDMAGYGHGFGDPPAQQQLLLAETLAGKAGMRLPDSAKLSKGGCSCFIDELLARKSPMQKQTNYAEQIPRAAATEPWGARKAYSKFADEMTAAQTPQWASERQETLWQSQQGRSRFMDEAMPPRMYEQASEGQAAHIPATQKQVAYAEELAWNAGLRMPEGVRQSSQRCAEFIDELLAVRPPTQKQVAYAEELAWNAGLRMPEGVRQSSQRCAEFIDELLGEKPPTQKQVAFLEALAREMGQQPPEGAWCSSLRCTQCINELLRAKRGAQRRLSYEESAAQSAGRVPGYGARHGQQGFPGQWTR